MDTQAENAQSIERICFVIAPIGDQESDTRKRSDQVLKHVIKPAATECSYNAIRSDEIAEPGLITSQVIQHIVDDPIVIADLTERNPNVFYELAIRHALKKPFVQIIKKGEQLPFDVAGMRTISVDHHDLDSVEVARKEIVSQIKSVEDLTPEQVETPISVSLELQFLRQSENPEQRSLADLVAAVSDVRSGFNNLEKRISDPRRLIPEEYLNKSLARVMNRFNKNRPALESMQLRLDDMHSLLDRLSEHSSDEGMHKFVLQLQMNMQHLQQLILQQ